MTARKPKTYAQQVIQALVCKRLTHREAVSCLSRDGMHWLSGAYLFIEKRDFNGRAFPRLVRSLYEQKQ
jgi:hypothetical protein